MGILLQITDKIKQFIYKGHSRSVKAKKNILVSLLVKGLSIGIGFLLVPLTIGYVSEDQYGIWMTLSSVVAWFSFFDIGLGHGLRNRFAEALAEGNFDQARTYVSTTYAILAIICGAIFLCFLAINPFLDWASIVNGPAEQANELSLVATIIFSFFCLNFVLKIITTIIAADQRPAWVDMIQFGTNALSLLIIFLLTIYTEGSLFYLALVLGITPVLVMGIVTIAMYATHYKKYAPSIKFVEFSYFKDLMSLGGQFFVVQIVAVIIFSTDNIIIAQLFGSAEVTPYTIAHKYFGMLTKVFTIISLPFWSAYTEAYVKKDMDWIQRSNKKLLDIWKLLLGGSIVMLIGANLFYSIWVPTVTVPWTLSFFMAVYVVVLAWGTIFVMFTNGVGKVRLQLVTSIFGGALNIPLSIFLARNMGMGSAGVILASTLCLGYGPFLAPLQYKKLVNGTAKGIWNK